MSFRDDRVSHCRARAAVHLVRGYLRYGLGAVRSSRGSFAVLQNACRFLATQIRAFSNEPDGLIRSAFQSDRFRQAREGAQPAYTLELAAFFQEFRNRGPIVGVAISAKFLDGRENHLVWISQEVLGLGDLQDLPVRAMQEQAENDALCVEFQRRVVTV